MSSSTTCAFSMGEWTVDFIVDVLKLALWIVSQIPPDELFHLAPDVRTLIRNKHHDTLKKTGIFKEFNDFRLILFVPFSIYEAKLPHVEHGVVNCTTVTITRVGSKLVAALPARGFDRV